MGGGNVDARGVNGQDRGSISVMVAITAVSLVAVVGLVLDFGGQLRATERADAIAQEAARVAGQQLDIDRLRSGGGYQVDPGQAESAARAYLASQGVAGRVDFPQYPDLSVISVSVTSTYRTALLGVVGITTLSVQGHGKATLLHGITEGTTG
ncbi:pilus assembly protein TadG-related protein [Kitasatospora phosalacinea]|uniref:pilus assembly protein TadG-related protein n=1 Tax=Kitasatospora phosalacinea TaxID=2065 RepID=UPI002D21BD9D|nr:pilus assembly protein TadG-related protein [Kitasatospora phosalacinea]